MILVRPALETRRKFVAPYRIKDVFGYAFFRTRELSESFPFDGQVVRRLTIQWAPTWHAGFPSNRQQVKDFNHLRASGAQERTRTFTAVKPLAPEASASTNSATWARGRLVRSGIAIVKLLKRRP
jgi:hypothetical protein